MPPTHRLHQGPYYTVINRTINLLSVRVDGVTWTFKPGRTHDVPSAVCQFAQRQHPRMGTSNESLLAVDGITPKEECRMIPPGDEHKGLERIDRVMFPDERGQVRFERLGGGLEKGERGPTLLRHEVSAIEMIGPARDA